MFRKLRVLLFLSLLCTSSVVFASSTSGRAKATMQKKSVVRTEHSVRLPGTRKKLKYKASVGEIKVVVNKGGKKYVARVNFVAYESPGPPDRPYTFFLPGGPGGAATSDFDLMEQGHPLAFGPKRSVLKGKLIPASKVLVATMA